jgi:CheY-like chemotaxis protein
MSTHATNGRLRVLVVDDYAPMADHLAKVLCDNGFTAVAVYSSADALRTAEQFMPHALIAEAMMPEMNGAELVYTLAEKFPFCRAMLITTNQWLSDVFIRGVRIKVFQKAFDLDEVFKFVGSLRA